MPQQFVDQSSPSRVNHTIQVGGHSVNAYTYVTKLYGVTYGRRGIDVGCLAAFIVGLQTLHIFATRFRTHINR